MSTEKSLIKHLKSKDEFLVANFSNYFEKHSGWDSSSYIQHTFQAGQQKNRFPSRKRTLRNRYTFVAATFETGTIQTCERADLLALVCGV